jgi:hypothetical protein
MSSSRLERAAQTCSSRFELDETFCRFWESRPFCGCEGCCWVYSLYSALSKTPLLERRLVGLFRGNRSKIRFVNPPSMDSLSLASTEVSVDSDTFEARNWTCRRAVSPADIDQVDVKSSSMLLFLSLLLSLISLSPLIASIGAINVDEDDESPLMPFIAKIGAGFNEREDAPERERHKTKPKVTVTSDFRIIVVDIRFVLGKKEGCCETEGESMVNDKAIIMLLKRSVLNFEFVGRSRRFFFSEDGCDF